MKDIVVSTLVILAIFFPWILGLVDGISYFFVSHAVTGVPWFSEEGWRIAAAVFYPIVALFFAGIIGAGM